jgi:hypothetical protein
MGRKTGVRKAAKLGGKDAPFAPLPQPAAEN